MSESRGINTVELKKLMVENNLTKIKDLSAASGVTRKTLSGILNKKKLPSSETIYKLINALNIPIDKAGVIFFSPDLPNK